MSQTKYARKIYMERGSRNDSFFLGYDALVLLVVFVFMNAFVLFQYFQSPDVSQDLIFIGIFQLLMGIGGLSVGAVILRDRLEIGMLNKRRVVETYKYGIMFASFVMVMDMFLGMAFQSEFDLMSGLGGISINIPITAGVVEEALFSLTIASLLYLVFKEIFKGMGQMGEFMAIAMATIFTATFFAMIHMYVYRNDMNALIMMFANRLVYCSVFLKYKNFSMIVFMHIFHNGLILFMSAL